jgi:phosphate transport system protein
MTRHFQREVEQLKEGMLELCAMVERNLALSIRALQEWDAQKAGDVIALDSAIDQAEVDLEEDCLKVLALYQPVAIDLRLIIATLKITNDLERIGDLAVNIAKRVKSLAKRQEVMHPFDFEKMSQLVCDMLRQSVDALVNLDVEAAVRVCKADDEVDRMNRAIFRKTKEAAGNGEANAAAMIDLLFVARSLERIGDHATNIAEDVIYMISGDVVRHSVGAHARRELRADDETPPEEQPKHG